jgi:hypothetical protein
MRYISVTTTIVAVSDIHRFTISIYVTSSQPPFLVAHFVHCSTNNLVAYGSNPQKANQSASLPPGTFKRAETELRFNRIFLKRSGRLYSCYRGRRGDRAPELWLWGEESPNCGRAGHTALTGLVLDNIKAEQSDGKCNRKIPLEEMLNDQC